MRFLDIRTQTWKDIPCPHPSTGKQYSNDLQTGLYECHQCGKEFSQSEYEEMLKQKNKINEPRFIALANHIKNGDLIHDVFRGLDILDELPAIDRLWYFNDYGNLKYRPYNEMDGFVCATTYFGISHEYSAFLFFNGHDCYDFLKIGQVELDTLPGNATREEVSQFLFDFIDAINGVAKFRKPQIETEFLSFMREPPVSEDLKIINSEISEEEKEPIMKGSTKYWQDSMTLFHFLENKNLERLISLLSNPKINDQDILTSRKASFILKFFEHRRPDLYERFIFARVYVPYETVIEKIIEISKTLCYFQKIYLELYNMEIETDLDYQPKLAKDLMIDIDLLINDLEIEIEILENERPSIKHNGKPRNLMNNNSA